MRMRRRGGFVTILAMVLAGIPAASAPGASSSDLKTQIEQAKRSLATIGKSLNAAERDLAFAEVKITEHRTALAEARTQGSILRAAISQHAADLYRSADAGIFQILAEGTDLDTVMDRISYLDQLRRGQTQMLEEAEALRRYASDQTRALRAARARAQQLRDTLAARRTALSSKLTELERLSNFLGSLSGRTIIRSSRSGGRGMACPVIGYQYINNNFGDRRPGGPHTGIDISAHYGRPVVAVLPGTIVDTPYGGWIGIGIILRDLVGNEWWYAHLSSENVRVGQRVAPGEVIGKVGCTGTCYGNHLHFEYHPGGGGPTNPYSLVTRAC